jgi:PKD repeat protein
MKKVIRMKYLLLIVFPTLMLSCSGDEPPQPEKPTGVPVISFVSGNDERKLKIGESVTLTATIENAEQPVFSWKIDGKIVSTETVYTFVAERLGEYFANFRVDAANGSAEGQIKISVLEKVPPKITLASAQVAYSGVDTEFSAEADNAENATYVWRLNGEIVSTTATYIFNKTPMGNYMLTLKVITDEGEDLKTITITVLPQPQPELFFDNGRYRTVTNAAELRKMTVPLGKKIVLAPVICNIANPAAFEWKVDGAVQTAATGEYFTFTPTEKRAYRITVAEQSTGAATEVEVTCTEPEGTHRRGGGAKAHATDAFDYCPAPGQFINYQTGSTKAKALQDLQTWCSNGAQGYFMIGAYGGYFIVGFDHSVANEQGKADLQVNGNPFAGWCEPGIVWVMQDENGNGQPDDTWYELKGSETGKTATKQRCAMTYYKPKAANSNTLWTDNTGRIGSVDWIGAHQQQYYFPMFIAEEYYTLTGTCLAATAGITGGLETSACYDWGYVDNISSDVTRATAQFWIEDAIHADGSPASLQYIDFVKVHTATIGKGAAVGEISTEPYLPVDLNFNNN